MNVNTPYNTKYNTHHTNFLRKKTLKRNLFSVSTAHCPDSNPYAILPRTIIEYHNQNHLSSIFLRHKKEPVYSSYKAYLLRYLLTDKYAKPDSAFYGSST